MAIRVPSHLYRNRHGGFSFRLKLPKDVRLMAGCTEVRMSLGTEVRAQAVATALPLIARIPGLLAQLRAMTDNQDEKTPAPDMKALLAQALDAARRAQLLEAKEDQIGALQDQLREAQRQLADSVLRSAAINTAREAHTLGQLKGRTELEKKMLPWSAEFTEPVSVLIKAYLKSKTIGRRPASSESLRQYRPQLELFIQVMGDLRIGAIDTAVADEYQDKLRRWPANANKAKRYQGKTADEILAMNPEPQNPRTASTKIERMSEAFTWAVKDKHKWGIDSNPFSGRGLTAAQEKDGKRRAFTQDELRALLGHESFVTREFFDPYAYWMIVLAIFTGARQAELAQLDVVDFNVEEGVDCIDINDEEEKRLKNHNARRLVPVHPELIRLGLLRYVEERKAAGDVHLFPGLSRAGRGPGQTVSRWFNERFRKAVGVGGGISGKVETKDDRGAVFHSFRHYFITTLLDCGVPVHQVAPVVGHEAELITGKVYFDTRDATKRKPTVDAFKLPPDLLAMIPVWEDVQIVSGPGPKPGRKLARATRAG